MNRLLLLLFLPGISAAATLFGENSVLQISLDADFEAVYRQRNDESFFTPVTFRELLPTATPIEGEVQSRGMSSIWQGEGDFPKLKLEFKKSAVKNSILEDSRKVRLNTHVSTHPTRLRTNLGRLNDERSPFREALVFDLADALGFPTHLHRRARVDYHDTGSGESFRRMALFLETDGEMTDRNSAREITMEEFASEQDTKISDDESARVNLFETLVGNDDYFFRTFREAPRADDPMAALGNIIVIEYTNGTRALAPYDFDLSTFVSGEGRLKDFWKTYPAFQARTESQSYQAWAMTSLRARHPQASIVKALEFYQRRRPQIEELIANAEIDPIGRRIAQRHVERFFEWTAKVMRWEVTGRTDIPLLEAPGGRSKLNPRENGRQRFLRPGTPLIVLGKEAGYARVVILDFKWDIIRGENSEGFIPEEFLALPDFMVLLMPEKYLSY